MGRDSNQVRLLQILHPNNAGHSHQTLQRVRGFQSHVPAVLEGWLPELLTTTLPAPCSAVLILPHPLPCSAVLTLPLSRAALSSLSHSSQVAIPAGIRPELLMPPPSAHAHAHTPTLLGFPSGLTNEGPQGFRNMVSAPHPPTHIQPLRS